MVSTTEFRLPDLGEGLTEGEIVRWLVAVGDEVSLNQPIVEVETAKALVEIPSPHAGTVAQLLCEQGTTVDVGAPIIAFTLAGTGSPSANGAAVAATESAGNKEDAKGASSDAPERTSVLVGYGPSTAPPKRRAKKSSQASGQPSNGGAAEQVAAVLAKPPVRKLARELGVDLRAVHPTGPRSSITRTDVKDAAASSASATIGAAGPSTEDLPREERIPIRGVRRATADAMVESAFTAPHTSVTIDVDMTNSMALIARLRAMKEFAEVRVGPLLLVAMAVVRAVERQPMVNAAWLEETHEIVLKRYVNLGIAVATERGLVVPNIKDAQTLSTKKLANALTELVATARAGRATPHDLSGGTISITNIGVFGVDGGAPILPPKQSAILAIGAIRPRPWVYQGEVVPRDVARVTMSFDHRIVDGEQGAKFVADVASFLTDPELALLAWG